MPVQSHRVKKRVLGVTTLWCSGNWPHKTAMEMKEIMVISNILPRPFGVSSCCCSWEE